MAYSFNQAIEQSICKESVCMKKLFKNTVLCFAILCLPLTACQAEEEQVSAVSQEPLKRLPFLVVDLDGDGIELISLEESNVYFDVDVDGLAERTQWVHPDDGFLSIMDVGDGKLNSVYSLTMSLNTVGLKKISKYDKNTDGIYNELDYKQLPRGKKYSELGFFITHDKRLTGIPSGKRKNFIPCELEYFSLKDTNNMSIHCEGGKVYHVKELYFEYEDTNIIWKEMCEKLRKNYHQTEDSKRDYTAYCIQETQQQGE